MGGLFGGGGDSGMAQMRAEQEKLRKERERIAAENAEKERVAAEERRMRLSGMFGTKMLMEEDETGFLRKKKKPAQSTVGTGASVSTDTYTGS